MSLFNLLPHHYEAVLPSSLPIKMASKALTKPNLYCRCRRQLRTVRQQLWGREMSGWFHLPRNVSMAQFQLSAALLFPRDSSSPHDFSTFVLPHPPRPQMWVTDHFFPTAGVGPNPNFGYTSFDREDSVEKNTQSSASARAASWRIRPVFIKNNN